MWPWLIAYLVGALAFGLLMARGMPSLPKDEQDRMRTAPGVVVQVIAILIWPIMLISSIFMVRKRNKK